MKDAKKPYQEYEPGDPNPMTADEQRAEMAARFKKGPSKKTLAQEVQGN